MGNDTALINGSSINMVLRLSALVSDHMVLQRDKPWVISGKAEPNAEISVQFGDQGTITPTIRNTTADEYGNWQVDLGEFAASDSPHSLIVSENVGSHAEQVSISDIVIGDVWLLSGQSNMELWLSRTAHNYPDVMQVSDPLLRQVAMPQEPHFDKPISALEVSKTEWKSFTPLTAPDFSAVGYFFGAKLRFRYQIPIGLIAAAVGGTPISAWLPRAELDDLRIDCTESDKFASAATVANLTETEQAANNRYYSELDAADHGLSENWADPQFDDSTWETTELTDYVTGSGSHWYRKSLPVPPELSGRPAQIFLGTAIDMDTVFINGENIGTTYYRYPPRNYSFTMPVNNITVAIRLLTFSGGGEFTPGKNRFIATDKGTLSLDEPWKTRTGALVSDAPPQTRLVNFPSGLYNGMIAPLAETQLKGVAWYQGESDTNSPDNYGAKLTALIQSWRNLFGDSELPFAVQQVAHWSHTGSAGSSESDADHQQNWEKLRNQQKLALQLKNVGLSAGYDVGEWNDLHPQGKQIVGERLARLAYRLAYGELLPPNMFEQYTLA